MHRNVQWVKYSVQSHGLHTKMINQQSCYRSQAGGCEKEGNLVFCLIVFEGCQVFQNIRQLCGTLHSNIGSSRCSDVKVHEKVGPRLAGRSLVFRIVGCSLCARGHESGGANDGLSEFGSANTIGIQWIYCHSFINFVTF